MKTKQTLMALILVLGLVLVLWALNLGVGVPMARAASFTVCPAGPPTCDYSTIQAAVDAANGGDTIFVATGTYTGSGNEVVLLNKSVTLSGGWNTTFTTQDGMSTIDGQGLRQGITVDMVVSPPVVIIEYFTILNGAATQGGGVYVGNGQLTLTNSIVRHNTGHGIFGWIGSNLILVLSITPTVVSTVFRA